MEINKIYHGDCLSVLKDFPDNSVQLIITSPPYGIQRKETYGGIDTEEYVEWFLPRAEQFQRVLKKNGSFVLNIKENVVKKERHTYVLELVLALRKMGWKWIEQYMWHKSSTIPRSVNIRFRDAWESWFHFSKSFDILFNKDVVKVPPAAATLNLNYNPNWKEYKGMKSNSGSGFTHGFAMKEKIYGMKEAYPTNVLHGSPVNFNVNHPAAFPVWIPDFFIKLMTDEKDIVLDPFIGSGSTAISAANLNRNWIGIEKKEEYIEIAWDRIRSNMKQK